MGARARVSLVKSRTALSPSLLPLARILMSTLTHYVPMWQTWHLLSEQPSSAAKEEDAASPPAATAESARNADSQMNDLRPRVQIARIRRRISIAELADMVECDVETISSFERGENVVGEEMEQRLRDALDLPRGDQASAHRA